MKKLILLFTFCCFLFCAIGYGSPSIRFGVVNLYPPFVAKDSLGHHYGFDIAIANALCHELGRHCEFVSMPFNKLFNALNTNQVDAIISAITITSERQKLVDFTIPYYHGTASYLAAIKNQPIVTQVGLKDQKIGALTGTIFSTYLKQKFPDSEVINFITAEDAIDAMVKRDITLVLLDTLNAKWWVNSISEFKIINTTDSLPSAYGIAVRKGNKLLLNDLNGALSFMIHSGKYQKIKQLYADFDFDSATSSHPKLTPEGGQ